MKFIQTPVKGMQDFLPSDMALRQHVLGLIRDTYAKYGFDEIETPVMEHIENLTGRDGGENEKLIFKVLKRGAELERGMKSGELADSALRYDLTVPLCRYYANHHNDLPSPFKALQIGNVFRADRPQKGRFRQFTQCDIDIIGDNSIMAEIELIAATSKALTRIFEEVGISGFTVHINDRRVLRAMAANAGFAPEQFDDIFIILDKMDKIGLDGVKENLLDEGYAAEAVERYVSCFRLLEEGKDMDSFISLTCGEDSAGLAENLSAIIDTAGAMTDDAVTLKFDPTLVRGMGYYTGTIFEISIDNYSFSIAGGGRYDKMVGRFCGQDAPACGFSIGFERIVTILRDLNWKLPESRAKKAYLLDMKGASGRMKELFTKASELRGEGTVVTVQPLRKNAKYQIDMLEKIGYSDIIKVYNDTEL